MEVVKALLDTKPMPKEDEKEKNCRREKQEIRTKK